MKIIMCNMGKRDRMTRIVIGAFVLAGGILAHSWVISILGAIPLVSAVYCFCPLYKLLGISTQRK